MSSRGVGAFRPIARAGLITSSIALLAMVFSPFAASAATSSLGSATGITTCAAGFSEVQVASSIPGAYAVPIGGGTITAWSTLASTDTTMLGPVGLQVWRPIDPLTTTYELIGVSPLVPVNAGIVNNFTLATPIPVREGDVLGLRVEGAALCGSYGGSGSSGFLLGTNPLVGAVVPLSIDRFFDIDIEATLETTPPPPPSPSPSPSPPPSPSPSPTPSPSSDCNEHGQHHGNNSDCQN
jgi:hypothetical protein